MYACQHKLRHHKRGAAATGALAWAAGAGTAGSAGCGATSSHSSDSSGSSESSETRVTSCSVGYEPQGMASHGFPELQAQGGAARLPKAKAQQRP